MPNRHRKARDRRDAPIMALPLPRRTKNTPYNASEVVALADSRFLFCDNNVSDALYEMRLTKTGELDGRLIPHRIVGVSPRYLDDFESMAMIAGSDPYRLVLATSFSLKIRDPKARKKSRRAKPAIERESLLRVTLRPPDARSRRTGARELDGEIVPGFRQWLIEETPDLGPQWRKSLRRIPDDGGLNIEGLSWDPVRSDLLFGLRTPVLEGKPVVLRVHVKAIGGIWNLTNFEMRRPVLLELPAAKHDRGIRTMEYDADRKTTLIVTGNAVSDSKAPFEMYGWDGNDKGVVKPFPRLRFDRKFRVEGAAPGTIAGRPVLVFVDDRGGYGVIWAGDERLRERA